MSKYQQNRYYFCQLKKDFFKEHPLDIIRGLDGGREALLLYIELLLDSAGHEGRLLFEDGVPYTSELIAAKFLTPTEVVNRSFDILKQMKLLEVEKNTGEIILTKFAEYIGNRSNMADYMGRKRRAESEGGLQGDNKGITNGLQGDNKRITKDNNVIKSIEYIYSTTPISSPSLKPVTTTSRSTKTPSSRTRYAGVSGIKRNQGQGHGVVAAADDDISQSIERRENREPGDEVRQRLLLGDDMPVSPKTTGHASKKKKTATAAVFPEDCREVTDAGDGES